MWFEITASWGVELYFDGNAVADGAVAKPVVCRRHHRLPGQHPGQAVTRDIASSPLHAVVAAITPRSPGGRKSSVQPCRLLGHQLLRNIFWCIAVELPLQRVMVRTSHLG